MTTFHPLNVDICFSCVAAFITRVTHYVRALQCSVCSPSHYSVFKDTFCLLKVSNVWGMLQNCSSHQDSSSPHPVYWKTFLSSQLANKAADPTEPKKARATLYIATVKKTLSQQNYNLFSEALQRYRSTADFNTMLAQMSSLFTEDEAKHVLLRGTMSSLLCLYDMTLCFRWTLFHEGRRIWRCHWLFIVRMSRGAEFSVTSFVCQK